MESRRNPRMRRKLKERLQELKVLNLRVRQLGPVDLWRLRKYSQFSALAWRNELRRHVMALRLASLLSLTGKSRRRQCKPVQSSARTCKV